MNSCSLDPEYYSICQLQELLNSKQRLQCTRKGKTAQDFKIHLLITSPCKVCKTTKLCSFATTVSMFSPCQFSTGAGVWRNSIINIASFEEELKRNNLECNKLV